MREEKIGVVQVVANEALERSDIHESISNEMKRKLSKPLMDVLETGKTFIVKLGAERQTPEKWTQMTKLSRDLYTAKVIRCMDCKQTPPEDEDLIKDLIKNGMVTQLYCRRYQVAVDPFGFCAWAEERDNRVDCPWK